MPAQDEDEETPAQDEDKEDDKDEHGYLVLLSDDALSLQGKRGTKNHESDAVDHGVKAETDKRIKKMIYSEFPPEYEKKVENVVDHAKKSEVGKGDATSVLGDKDENDNLVVSFPSFSLISSKQRWQ